MLVFRGVSGWWQLKYVWNFHPDNWGRFPFWRSYFSDGLVQPPSSKSARNFRVMSWMSCVAGGVYGRTTAREHGRQKLKNFLCKISPMIVPSTKMASSCLYKMGIHILVMQVQDCSWWWMNNRSHGSFYSFVWMKWRYLYRQVPDMIISGMAFYKNECFLWKTLLFTFYIVYKPWVLW